MDKKNAWWLEVRQMGSAPQDQYANLTYIYRLMSLRMSRSPPPAGSITTSARLLYTPVTPQAISIQLKLIQDQKCGSTVQPHSVL